MDIDVPVRLEIPISHRVLYATGDVKLWADINLLLKDGAGNWQPETFRVDSATELTTFSAYDARRIGLPMPQRAAHGAIHAPTGLEIRSGVLRFRIDGMDQTEYVTPTLFLGDPKLPPNPQHPPSFPRKLLQPFHLLAHLHFMATKDPALGNLYGEVVFEKR